MSHTVWFVFKHVEFRVFVLFFKFQITKFNLEEADKKSYDPQ